MIGIIVCLGLGFALLLFVLHKLRTAGVSALPAVFCYGSAAVGLFLSQWGPAIAFLLLAYLLEKRADEGNAPRISRE